MIASGEVVYSSPGIPPEWIRAHGLIPRPAWTCEASGSGPRAISEGVCAFADSLVDLSESFPEVPLVFSSTCDQMRRANDATHTLAPRRLFLFNAPVVWQSPVARRIYRAELERLGRFLVDVGGRAPSAAALRDVMIQYSQARAQLREARLRYPAVQFAGLIDRLHQHGDVESAEPEAKPAADAVPMAIVGGPVSVSRRGLLGALEQSGGRIVLDATASGERGLLPPLAEPEKLGDPVELLVDHYLRHWHDVAHRPSIRLHAWLRHHLSASGARGLMVWSYVGCDFWRAEAANLRGALKLPILTLDLGETEQTSNRDLGRIEAFLEMLR